MMKKMCRLVAELAMAIACAGMWGCGDSESFEWEERGPGSILSLVDDSLALVYNCRSYSICKEGVGPLGYSDCGGGCENYGLFLVNYREKNVYWGDSSENVLNFMLGFYRDSSVIFLKDGNKKFGFWKIGGKPGSVKNLTWNSPCKGYDGFSFSKFRPWKHGNVLVINAKGCTYSVLDTTTGNVDELSLDGEYAWLKDCDDVTYLNENVVCLKAVYDNSRYGIHLVKNGELTDSLIWEGAKWSIESNKNIEIYGNAFILNHPTRMNNYDANTLSGKNLNLIEPLCALNPIVKMDYYLFVDSAGNKLQYTSDDLTITKGTR